ncbi:MAG TPA: hypothetical protein VIX19_10855 [Terriglobales bacterium]
MKRVILALTFLWMTSTILSAQRLSEPPQPQLTASTVRPGEGLDVQLLPLLDLSDASKAITAAAAANERPTPEPLEMSAPPAFRSTNELSEANRFPQFSKKIFVAEFVSYTVPNILDGITTVRGVQRGFTEAPFPKGASELLGSRPGATRYILTMGAMQTVATIASYRLQHSRSRVLRMLGHSIMAEGIVDHTSGFVNNLMLGSHP